MIKNNREEILILLCPNCHSFTSTFGRGREKRRLKLQEISYISIR